MRVEKKELRLKRLPPTAELDHFQDDFELKVL